MKEKKQDNFISCQYIKKDRSLPPDIWRRLHGVHSGANVPSHLKRVVIYTLSMLWQANPTIEALSSYPLTKLQIEIFLNKFAKIEKGLLVAQQNQDHCTPYMCVMTLLDSRVGRSQFRSR